MTRFALEWAWYDTSTIGYLDSCKHVWDLILTELWALARLTGNLLGVLRILLFCLH